MTSDETFILVGHCPDQVGLVARITGWIQQTGGNILDLEQHVDQEENRFFIRIEWTPGTEASLETVRQAFHEELGRSLGLEARIESGRRKLRVAVFVSQLDHCLWDLLARHQAGQWNMELPLIVSNHDRYAAMASSMGAEFLHTPVNADNKTEMEALQMEKLEKQSIDLVILARYMQVLSPAFVARYPNRIINIHHSFLPAFPGAKPYHQAHQRGVKIIGATAHYVTSDLDEGPIIEQDTARVSHRDDVSDLVRKGRDLEKIVLARAVHHHLRHAVLPYGNRTCVFE